MCHSEGDQHHTSNSSQCTRHRRNQASRVDRHCRSLLNGRIAAGLTRPWTCPWLEGCCLFAHGNVEDIYIFIVCHHPLVATAVRARCFSCVAVPTDSHARFARVPAATGCTDNQHTRTCVSTRTSTRDLRAQAHARRAHMADASFLLRLPELRCAAARMRPMRYGFMTRNMLPLWPIWHQYLLQCPLSCRLGYTFKSL